jgi:two-component system response regulator DevR
MAKLGRVTDNNDGRSALNDGERALLALLGDGVTNTQIATRMLLTEEVVKNQVSRLLVKLGVAR